MTKKLDKLEDKILDNVVQDRKTAEDFLININNYISDKFDVLNGEEYSKVMMSAAKMVESLQKSNEHIVRILEINSKKKVVPESNELTKEEIERLWKEETVETSPTE